MAETSYFFDSVGGDRTYSAGSFADWLYAVLEEKNGVIRGIGNTLAVSAGGALASAVDTGAATLSGRAYRNSASLNVSHDAVTTNYTRIDRVVIRFDETTNRSANATVIKGTAVAIGNTPTAPAIVSATDIMLYQVLITNTAGTYAYTYTDEREYRELNAETLDTLNSGNASGNIPISNGAINTNLNADKLDGYDFNNLPVAPQAIVTLTSGSGNWTVPAGVTRLKVKCVGGGGGGGGGKSGDYSYGGGGGGGTDVGSVIASILSVTPGQLIAYSVGAGGSAGALGGNGGDGGTTTFGSVTAGGGGGGNSTTVSRVGLGGLGAPNGAGVPGSNGMGQDGGGAGGNGGGCGGRGGGYINNEIISATSGSYGGGGGGGKGAYVGAAGGSGIIIIEY